MVDTCVIKRPGRSYFDPELRQYVDEEPVVVYSGRCRWRDAYPAPQSVQAGQVQWAVDIVIVSIPVAEAGGLENGCVIELTHSALDPASVGVTATVMADHVQTYSTACRVPARIVSSHV